MAGSGFSVTISAADKASATLDRVNKRIAALRAPADRFGKALAKFSDVSGVNRMAEGVKVLGNHSLSFARSIEKAAGPMATITSAASIAGVIELSRQWAKAGNSIRNVSYALAMPVDRVSALQGGAKLAGSSVEAMTKSLQGANDAIKDAQFHRQDAATPYWQMLHIAPVGPDGKPITPDQMLRQFADATKNMTPHARMRAEGAFGIDPSLDPMLRNGSKGFDAYVAQAQKSGGVMTQQMADDAKKMNTAWQKLGLSLEGVENTIIDKLAPDITNITDRVSNWASANRSVVASGFLQWLEKIGRWFETHPQLAGAVLGAVAGGKVAGPVGAVVGAAGGALAGTGPLPADLGNAPAGRVPFSYLNPGSWLAQGNSGGRGASPLGNAPRLPTTAAGANVMNQASRYFRNHGWSAAQTAGLLANMSSESGFNPEAAGDYDKNGRPTSFGLFQFHGPRTRALEQYARQHGWQGGDPRTIPAADQLGFAQWELTKGDQTGAGASLARQTNARGAGYSVSDHFERPAGGGATDAMRGSGADQFMAAAGAVKVDVHLHGAPPGTTATATASGIATAAPPRIATSMPFAR